MLLLTNHLIIQDIKNFSNQLDVQLRSYLVKVKEIIITHYLLLILIQKVLNLYGIQETTEALKKFLVFPKSKHLLHFKFQDQIQLLLFKILTSFLNALIQKKNKKKLNNLFILLMMMKYMILKHLYKLDLYQVQNSK